MSIPKLCFTICTLLCAGGCVNPTASTLRDTKVAPGYTAPRSEQKPAPPRTPPDTYRSSDSGRTYSLTLKNAELNDVLMLLSKESGVPIVAERALRGTVKIEAQNQKLGELLYAILKPLGYTANVENGIIMVGRPQLSTRTFRVNYLKDRRNSSSNMNVSGFAAGGSSGSVSVSTEGKSDFWGTLENSLELLVFGTSGQGKRESGGYIRGEAEKKSDTKNIPASTALTDKTTLSMAGDLPDPMLSSAQISEGRLKQLVVNEIAGIVQVTDYDENLDKIAAFLSDVEEGSKRQVMIQAHIMEVTLKDSFSLGIDWKYIIDKASNLTLAQTLVPATAGASAIAGSNVFRISASNNDFGVLLDAMKEQGNVNMLSSPKITALNNQKAVIKLTTKEVSWVSTKTTQNNAIGGQDTFTTTPQIDEVGIFLDVTPQIGPVGTITMQIHPSVSEIRELSVSPDKSSTKPVIDIREIDTMVDAKAGETIVIAGLISDKLTETKRSVPLLGDIPYLGTLFSYNKQDRAKTELVIMMTPYILNAKQIDDIRAEHEKRIRNMGGAFHLINNLGSLVTEKESRDWLMKTNHIPGQLPPSEPMPEKPEHPEKAAPTSGTGPLNKAAPRNLPGADQKMDKASTTTEPQKPQPPVPAAAGAEQPASSEPSAANQQPPQPVASTAKAVEQKTSQVDSSPQMPAKPMLQSVKIVDSAIRMEIYGAKLAPEVVREKRNGLVIVKIPGVHAFAGSGTVNLNSLGFEKARISRHKEGLWVVLHSGEQQLPIITPQTDAHGVTLAITPAPKPDATARRTAEKPPLQTADPHQFQEQADELARLRARITQTEQQLTREREEKLRLAQERDEKERQLQAQKSGEDITAVTPVSPAAPPTLTVKAEAAPAQVTAHVAGDANEQTLYRTAVAAYKIDNCRDAVKLLSRFITTYPNSFFAQDAAIYRSDCESRQR